MAKHYQQKGLATSEILVTFALANSKARPRALTLHMLSILIPTYDFVCYPLVLSLHQQATALGIDHEIIVADDGSRDQVKAIANHKINDLPHCRYVRRQENVGRSAIRNYLTRQAQGEWLLFMDSDAALPPQSGEDFLQRYLEAAEATGESRADVICGGIVHPDTCPDPHRRLRWKYEKDYEHRHGYVSEQFRSFSFMIRREVALHVPFDEGYRHYGYEDVQFGRDLQRAGYRIRGIDNPLLNTDIETNTAFLHKTEEALRTAHEFEDRLAEDITLLHLLCKHPWLRPLLRGLSYLCGGAVRRHLEHSTDPSLRLFALHKLMYYVRLASLLLLLLPLSMRAELRLPAETLDALCLPVLEFTTLNGELPTCTYVTHPEGAMGESIANATKVPARLTIRQEGKQIYDSGEYQADVAGVTLRIRGNTSAYRDKKPYKIKLQRKADLLMRHTDSDLRDKDWILLDRGDRAMLGLEACRLAGQEWTPACRYVNVVINGDYQGLYILCESVKHNDKCRISLDREEGYIIERDAYWWKEDYCVTSPLYGGPQYKWTFKYPEEPTSLQQEYIAQRLAEVEQSIEDGTYPAYIDVESYARWLMLQDFLGNWDSGGSNMYFVLRDVASPLAMTTLWDFDHCMRMTDSWSRIHMEDPVFQRLLNSSNPLFQQTYSRLWYELGDQLLAGLQQWVEDYRRSQLSEDIETSLAYDKERWNYTDCPLLEDFDTDMAWLVQHTAWMHEHVGTLVNVNANLDLDLNDNCCYDLQGRRVSQRTQHGLLIHNGRKFIY